MVSSHTGLTNYICLQGFIRSTHCPPVVTSLGARALTVGQGVGVCMYWHPHVTFTLYLPLWPDQVSLLGIYHHH